MVWVQVPVRSDRLLPTFQNTLAPEAIWDGGLRHLLEGGPVMTAAVDPNGFYNSGDDVEAHQEETHFPPHDLDAERAVLSAVMIDETALGKVEGLKPEHFYSEAHRRIFESCVALAPEGRPDVVRVAHWLRDQGRLQQVGDVPDITELLNAAPAVSNVANYARIVQSKAAAREMLAAVQSASARLYTGASVASVREDLEAKLQMLRDRSDYTRTHILSPEELFAPEQSSDCVVPHLGICAGPPTGLVGEAYSGKSLASTALGLSVASGFPLWNKWRVKEGVWLYLDYEQGRRHTKNRIRRVARGMGLSDEELRYLVESRRIRVAVFPELNLTSEKATDHYRKLLEGVTVVTCDSLRVMLGGVDENSSQVRPLMQHLTRASEASGAAVVQVIHGGKPPASGKSGRSRKHAARGSSAIIDELQTMLVLTKAKGDELVLVSHEKDRELGYTVPDFGLQLEDVANGSQPKWGLKLTVADDVTPPVPPDVLSEVLEFIRKHPGVEGIDAIREGVKRKTASVTAAVQSLLASRQISFREGRTSQVRRYFTSDAAPTE